MSAFDPKRTLTESSANSIRVRFRDEAHRVCAGSFATVVATRTHGCTDQARNKYSCQLEPSTHGTLAATSEVWTPL
jgi:hypothetical protein